tara:strand:- start:8217 stop:8420 length:204 start_codon:yes stop_codon:yes gene_type:complete
MIKVLLFIILGYYLLRLVFPFLLRFFISRLSKNVEKEFRKNNRENNKDQNKSKSSNMGEYIDYEEID